MQHGAAEDGAAQHGAEDGPAEELPGTREGLQPAQPVVETASQRPAGAPTGAAGTAAAVQLPLVIQLPLLRVAANEQVPNGLGPRQGQAPVQDGAPAQEEGPADGLPRAGLEDGTPAQKTPTSAEERAQAPEGPAGAARPALLKPGASNGLGQPAAAAAAAAAAPEGLQSPRAQTALLLLLPQAGSPGAGPAAAPLAAVGVPGLPSGQVKAADETGGATELQPQVTDATGDDDWPAVRRRPSSDPGYVLKRPRTAISVLQQVPLQGFALGRISAATTAAAGEAGASTGGVLQATGVHRNNQADLGGDQGPAAGAGAGPAGQAVATQLLAGPAVTAQAQQAPGQLPRLSPELPGTPPVGGGAVAAAVQPGRPIQQTSVAGSQAGQSWHSKPHMA